MFLKQLSTGLLLVTGKNHSFNQLLQNHSDLIKIVVCDLVFLTCIFFFFQIRPPCFEQSSSASGSPEVCHCHKHQNRHFWHEGPQKSERRLLQEEEAEEASSPGGRDLWYRKRGKQSIFSCNATGPPPPFGAAWVVSHINLCLTSCIFLYPSAEVPADRAEEEGPESCGRSAPAAHQENTSDERLPALHLLPV